ncbi:MAG: AsnC family transcriptional regulator [Dehalococcoidia bacterium]|nr:AsnC family transcriptional regulator [Dehalococcoidia bacterium]
MKTGVRADSCEAGQALLEPASTTSVKTWVSIRRLDELDLMLIRELGIDARKGAPELGAKLGTNHTTVRRRLQTLLDEGIISFVTIADHKTLGHLTLILLGINTRPGTVDGVATRIASLEYSKMISATLGRYDLLVMIYWYRCRSKALKIWVELSPETWVLSKTSPTSTL